MPVVQPVASEHDLLRSRAEEKARRIRATTGDMFTLHVQINAVSLLLGVLS
jgi:hypothetical protein